MPRRTILVAVTIMALGCSTTSVLKPTKLGFGSQPTTAKVNASIGLVTVNLLTDDGSTFIRSGDTVTVTLATNTTGAALSGTTTAIIVAGVTMMSDLSVDKPGTYTLKASARNLASGTSATFTITP